MILDSINNATADTSPLEDNRDNQPLLFKRSGSSANSFAGNVNKSMASGTGPISHVNATQGARQAMKYYVDKGVDRKVAAGIVGNLYKESGLNPNAKGDGGTSFGVAQWHNERFKGLQKYASKKGKSWNDLNTQLDYVLDEGYGSTLSKMKNASSASQSARIFTNEFERPNPKYADYGTRNGMAESLMKYAYGGKVKKYDDKVPKKDLISDPAHTLDKNTKNKMDAFIAKNNKSNYPFNQIDEDRADVVYKLQQISGNPSIDLKSSAGKKGAGKDRAFYNPYSNQMASTDLDDYIAELPHAYQFNNRNINQFGKFEEAKTYKNSKEYDKKEYSRVGSAEHQAHKIIQPEFTNTVFNPDGKKTKNIDSYMTPEIKKRYLARLYHGNLNGMVNKYPEELKYGGKIKKYAYGGPIKPLKSRSFNQVNKQAIEERQTINDIYTQDRMYAVSEPTLEENNKYANKGADYVRKWGTALGVSPDKIKTPSVMVNGYPDNFEKRGEYNAETDKATIRRLPTNIMASVATHEANHQLQQKMKEKGDVAYMNKMYNVTNKIDKSKIVDPYTEYVAIPEETETRLMLHNERINRNPHKRFNRLKWGVSTLFNKPDYHNDLRKVMSKKDIFNSLQDMRVKKYAYGGLIKRADGSYSKRGLWDNVRANKGSGKKPTKQMLAQEKKIEKKANGGPIKKFTGFKSDGEPKDLALTQGANFAKKWIIDRAKVGTAGLKPSDLNNLNSIKKPRLIDDKYLDLYDDDVRGVNLNVGNNLSLVRKSLDLDDIRSVSLHETTHAIQNNISSTEAIKNSYNVINEEVKRSNKGGSLAASVSGLNNYFAEPKEVHARTMELRKHMGLKPTDIVTEKSFEGKGTKMMIPMGKNKYDEYDIKNEAHKYTLEGLLENLDKKGIINVLNKTVMNKTNNRKLNYAAYGGAIPKKSIGGFATMDYSNVGRVVKQARANNVNEFAGNYASAIGTGLGFVGGMVDSGDTDPRYRNRKVATVSGALKGAGSGLSIGASIGSVVPGVGTLIGAGVGALVGGVAGAVSSNKKAKKEKLMYEQDLQNDSDNFLNGMKSQYNYYKY